MTSKKPLPPIETVLEDHAARPCLDTLVDSGCKRDELIALLSFAFLADEKWEKQIGMDLRGFKRTITHISHCADIIDRLNKSELIYSASIELSLPGFVGFLESPTLAERLREYATKLDWLCRVFGPKRRIKAHAWKAWIVAVVTEDTKKAHDFEVSFLIAAVLDDAKYSLDAHKTWRLKHLPLIEAMRKKLQGRRFKRIPPRD